jgi:hypothetical protein
VQEEASVSKSWVDQTTYCGDNSQGTDSLITSIHLFVGCTLNSCSIECPITLIALSKTCL